MRKKCLLFLLLFLPLVFFCAPVTAFSAETEQYAEQSRNSGADDLPFSLPEETRRELEALGISGADWQSITSLTPGKIFSGLGSMAAKNAAEPFHAAASVIGVVLLCALLNGLSLSFGERPLGGAVGMVGTLCVCALVVVPLVRVIAAAASVIKAGAMFLLACVPVLTAIMVAAGQPVSGSSYNLIMMAAGNSISLLASEFLVPLLNIYLAVSVVAAVSPGINLMGLCGAFNKIVKWVLGFAMTVFTGLLTVHGVVATALDSTGTRAARFVVSSFVPVVGAALGEALHTIGGCVKMLKAGVSAFALLAGCVLFLPVLLQCVLWLLTLYACTAVGEVFDLKEVTVLLRSAANVVQTMIAILLCSMTVLTVSTVVMLLIGGVAS